MGEFDPLSEPKRLLTLLTIAPAESSWNADELGAILAHQLDAPLAETIRDGLKHEPAPWRTLRELLSDRRAPAEWLERVKRFAKDASANPEFGVPKEVATVLYIASVVAGQRAGAALTKLDDAALRNRVAWALGRPWIDLDLHALFAGYPA